MPPTMRNCKQCKKLFESARGYSGYYYCSKECRQAYYLVGKYGLSSTEWLDLVRKQGFACAICREIGPLMTDHCHSTGRVRGLLCRRCNTGIGLLGDSIEIMTAACAYLMASHKQKVSSKGDDSA